MKNKYLQVVSSLFTSILVMACQTKNNIQEVIKVEDYIAYEEPFLLKPVIQFSCVIPLTKKEDALEVDLMGKDNTKKLRALNKLLNLSAPSSVPLQYKAFLELKDQYEGHDSIKRAKQAFNKKRIISVIEKMPPKEKFSADHLEFYWCIRAVGVLKMEESIPRLLRLSQADNLYTHLAAERSIEDFKGKKAEDALISVISYWRYDSFKRAANTMLKRNPALLSRELEKMTPPASYRHYYGLFLARCNNPQAIPHLCATVKDINRMDVEMFNHIARLGRRSDKQLILTLLKIVRTDQKDLAIKCINLYMKRIE